MINLLIVDDHPIVRRGMKEVLKDVSDLSLTEASDASEGLSQLKEQQFDLLILDLDMPGVNGLDLLRELKRDYKDVPVLILSVYPEDQMAIRALKAGASGFLSKETAPEQLVRAIRKILRGGKYISDRIAELAFTYLQGSNGHELHEALSDREFQVLRLIGEGKTIKQIADILCLSTKTISTYRARILEKMEMKTTAQLMRYAIQNKISNTTNDTVVASRA